GHLHLQLPHQHLPLVLRLNHRRRHHHHVTHARAASHTVHRAFSPTRPRLAQGNFPTRAPTPTTSSSTPPPCAPPTSSASPPPPRHSRSRCVPHCAPCVFAHPPSPCPGEFPNSGTHTYNFLINTSPLCSAYII